MAPNVRGVTNFLGGRGHEHMDVGASLHEFGAQVDCLVHGDAAGDAQKDVLVGEDVHGAREG